MILAQNVEQFGPRMVMANLARFPMGEKMRFIGRAVMRKVTG